MKHTAKNNILLATIAFMNDSNYQRAFQGLPVTIKGFTGQMLRDKQRKAKNDTKSRLVMKQYWGAKHYNKARIEETKLRKEREGA